MYHSREHCIALGGAGIGECSLCVKQGKQAHHRIKNPDSSTCIIVIFSVQKSRYDTRRTLRMCIAQIFRYFALVCFSLANVTNYAKTAPFIAGRLAPSRTPNVCKEYQPSSTRFFPVPRSYTSHLSQRTEIPDRLVNILAAMFIDANSWKSSFAAYGMWIWEIFVLFLQGRHSND